MSILAIDYGTVRMGFAISDKNQMISRSLKILNLKQISNIFKQIKHIIVEHSCEKVLIGLPINLNNKETQKTQEVRSFALELSKHITIPIEFSNEALTSYEADHILKNLGFLKYEKRNKRRDSMAAQILLQEYLDNNNLKVAKNT